MIVLARENDDTRSRKVQRPRVDDERAEVIDGSGSARLASAQEMGLPNLCHVGSATACTWNQRAAWLFRKQTNRQCFSWR